MAETHKNIVAKVVFEIVGSPKEHIVETLKRYLEAIKQDPEMKCSDEYFAEPEERDNLWSTFAEMDVEVKNLEKLTWLCVNFTPASVEIMEPSEFNFSDKDTTNLLNDLLAKLHELGIQMKNMLSENDLLKVNINHLIRNSIVITLKNHNEGLTGKELSKEIGITDDAVLKPFFEIMEKEGRIKKSNGVYQIA